MKILLFICLFPVLVSASVTVANNTDVALSVYGGVNGSVSFGTTATKTSMVFNLPATGGNIIFLYSGAARYSLDVVDGAFVAINPTFEISYSAPSFVWLDYFKLGFKIQMVFELFGFLIRLAGLLRKPTGSEL